ncbi:MAG: DUF2786 domain-containing protein [Actinobacteria bacterium]|nr:DUF2786 domain-containing protein [Actinomycetota bacterium]MBI3686695.1 DUF2786 domain-containing protein [Actinomycetota bacterium]
MGKANRQRRRMKEKARKRASTTHADDVQWVLGGPPSLEDRVALEVSAALHALDHDDRPAFEAAAARVAERPGIAGWARVAERALASYLQAALRELWRRGWQPADMVRVVGRQLSARHVRLSCDAIAAELQSYAAATIDPRWAAQLAELEVQVWWRADQTYLRAWVEAQYAEWAAVVACALEVFDLVAALPELQMLGPIPGRARTTGSAARRRGPAVDERVLSRVRAMLAKAESTTFPAEAETFTAAAQALMARHSIDLALLAATGTGPADEPTGRRLGIDNPYEGPKVMLLGAVAEANRCRTVWSRQLGFCTAVGFAADLDAVEILFTSLLLQATTAMTLAGSRTDAYGRSRTRSFRQSFLTAYASRIGERLTEATGAQTAQAASEPAGRNLLPVLAIRDKAVEDAVAVMFPQMTSSVLGSATDREGWISGRNAADLAALHTGRELPE